MVGSNALEQDFPNVLAPPRPPRRDTDRRNATRRRRAAITRAAPLLVALGLAAASCGSGPEPGPSRPNVVFLIADDQGFDDYGFMGAPRIETPALDALAASGTTFTHGFTTSSVCWPSLRSIITGLDPIQIAHHMIQARLDDWESGPPDLMPSFETLPRILGRLGYRSFLAGKFGETSAEAGGFTQAARLGHGDPTGAVVDMDEILSFIDDDPETPFFLWFAPMIPHLPHDPPGEFVARYENDRLLQPARLYYASCSWFDALAGRLLEHLEQGGLREDTIVVFLADNGWEQVAFVSKEPLAWGIGGRRGKLSLHERGFRTPIVLSWPERIPAGARSDALVSSLDLLPTVLDYLGQPAPPEVAGQTLRPVIDGARPDHRDAIVTSMEKLRPAVDPPRSRTPLERAAATGPRFALQPVAQTAFRVRTSDWSYLAYVDAGIEELYDLRADPGERVDVASRHPARLASMRQRVAAHRRDLTDPYRESFGDASAATTRARAAYAKCLREQLPQRWCTLSVSVASRAEAP